METAKQEKIIHLMKKAGLEACPHGDAVICFVPGLTRDLTASEVYSILPFTVECEAIDSVFRTSQRVR